MAGRGDEMVMSNCGSSVSVVEEIEGVLKLYSDGSVVRAAEQSVELPPLTDKYADEILYKDIKFDKTLGLWARLYLPPAAAAATTRLPVILYFHGGGFCRYTPRSPYFHRFCVKWAANVGALIVSVDYRLAPEHRLPAAYLDSISALQWLHSQSISGGGEGGADPWFDSRADFSRVFLMGESAGGNIAHRLALWSAGQDWVGNMRIRGLILLYPAFGGEARSASESEERRDNPTLTLEGEDLRWKLALPVGSNRDHYFCNPLVQDAKSQDDWYLARRLPPTVMVIGGRDILRDTQLEYCKFLKKNCGKQILEVMVCDEEDHIFLLLKMDEQSSIKVMQYASNFIKSAA